MLAILAVQAAQEKRVFIPARGGRERNAAARPDFTPARR
jgi:hypothetical protein